MNKYCSSCERDGSGNCPHSSELSDDQLLLRCVGKWAERSKLNVLKNYLELFNKAVYKIRPQRYFIDLFSGPGKCIIRGTKKVINGSPIIALEQEHPFTKCFFVDQSLESANTLEKRLEANKKYNNYQIIPGDCNSCIDKIKPQLETNSLSVAFIDPTGIQIKYLTIAGLVSKLKIDLIINYSNHHINRAYQYALKHGSSNFDDFFGSTDWKKHIRPPLINVADQLLPYYQKQIFKLGYKSNDNVPVYDSMARNIKSAPLYRILFFSKDKLGCKLWNGSMEYTPDINRRLTGF